jgi:hypothetical protein
VLTEEDRRKILEHPAAGADLLPDTMPAATKMVVRGHHENFDGTGYPHRQPGSSLHVFVRIARICDAFDAGTSDKLYTRPKSAVRVLWEMAVGPHRKCYDPVLMKVFGNLIQPFPIGAKLELMDGRTAVVVRYNRRAPFQPTVVVAFDEKGGRLPADRLVGPINVGEANSLALRAYAGEDLRYMQEVPAATEGAGALREVGEWVYP